MSSLLTKSALAASLKTQMTLKPFEKISIDDICRPVNVSRRNFYHHFADKYALLTWIYHDDFSSRLAQHPGWKIWDYVPVMSQYCYENRAFLIPALELSGQNSFRATMTEMLEPFVRRDFGDLFTNEKVFEFFLNRTTNAYYDSVQAWITKDPCPPPEVFADAVRRNVVAIGKRTWEIASSRGGELFEDHSVNDKNLELF